MESWYKHAPKRALKSLSTAVAARIPGDAITQDKTGIVALLRHTPSGATVWLFGYGLVDPEKRITH